MRKEVSASRSVAIESKRHQSTKLATISVCVPHQRKAVAAFTFQQQVSPLEGEKQCD